MKNQKNIKVIAFDLVGVLVGETNFPLSKEQDQLERYFGRDISNTEFYKVAEEIFKGKDIEKNIDFIIQNLYVIKNFDVIVTLKKLYPEIKIIIATNHVKNIKKFIVEKFNNVIDDFLISSDINLNKPHKEFFEYIVDAYKIKPDEMIFIDDNIENVTGAISTGINAVHYTKDKNLLEEINKVINS